MFFDGVYMLDAVLPLGIWKRSRVRQNFCYNLYCGFTEVDIQRDK